MRDSKIEWCHHTFNPWIGCTRVSEACKLCYAESDSVRWKRATWGPGQPRHRTALSTWQHPPRWNRAAARNGTRERVFSASLADLFDDEAPEGALEDFWDLVRSCKNLDWLLLTKRPQNILERLPADWGDGYENVWLGVTAENQRRADERIPILLEIPAAVRFISCEPLLEELDLTRYLETGQLHWVIAGGETGHGSRPMQADWARSLRDQVTAEESAFYFFKQWGDHGQDGVRVPRKKGGRVLDGRTWDEVPASVAPTPKVLPLTSRKGSRPKKSAKRKVLPALRSEILERTDAGERAASIAQALGLTIAQVAAIKAHRTRGRYGGAESSD